MRDASAASAASSKRCVARGLPLESGVLETGCCGLRFITSFYENARQPRSRDATCRRCPAGAPHHARGRSRHRGLRRALRTGARKRGAMRSTRHTATKSSRVCKCSCSAISARANHARACNVARARTHGPRAQPDLYARRTLCSRAAGWGTRALSLRTVPFQRSGRMGRRGLSRIFRPRRDLPRRMAAARRAACWACRSRCSRSMSTAKGGC